MRLEIGSLNQRATPWVTYAVLAGGMLTAILLVFLVRVQSSALEIYAAINQ